ncbi:MAG: serine hydrolase [Acidimicrobiales bacterium]
MSDLLPLPPQPADVAWPTVEWPTGPPDVEDPERLAGLVDHAFTSPAPSELGHCHALVVVHRGTVVVERYGPRFVSELEELAGVTPDQLQADSTHISWSMAKSILHAAVGVLVARGEVALDAPAPVPLWEDPVDPRHDITWDHLLTMRAGLAWEEEYYEYAADRVPDVITMLYGDGRGDMAAFAAGFPLQHEPGSDAAYCYSSGTSNVISGCVGRVVGGGEAGMRAFLVGDLFGPTGMVSAEPSFDRAGTFVASSFVDATALDFARFGLLYLRDGVWDGRRILPEGWVDHARLPRSPDEHFFHGAHWWTNGDHRGSFAADGFEGQRIYLLPDRDLVIVRLGKTHTDHSQTMDAHLMEVADCFASEAELPKRVG